MRLSNQVLISLAVIILSAYSCIAPCSAQWLPDIIYDVGDALDPTQRGGPLYRHPPSSSTINPPYQSAPVYRKTYTIPDAQPVAPAPAPAPDPYASIYLMNGTSREIWTAVSYLNSDTNSWVITGYWKIAPGDKTKVIAPGNMARRGTNFYFHAHTADGTAWGNDIRLTVDRDKSVRGFFQRNVTSSTYQFTFNQPAGGFPPVRASVQEPSGNTVEPYTKIYMLNAYNKEIWAAVGYKNADTNSWVVTGYWKVAPGDKVYVVAPSDKALKGGYFYFHAHTLDGLQWGSDKRLKVDKDNATHGFTERKVNDSSYTMRFE